MIKQLEGAISTPKQTSKRRWFSAGILATAFFVDRGEEVALSILWPQMHRSLSLSIGQLGPVLAIGQLVNTLTLPVWGIAVDRFSRKKLLVWFTGFWGLWTLAIGLIDTLPQLMLVRALSAVGLAVFLPAVFSLIGDFFDSQTRGRAIGLLRAVGLVSILVAFGGLPALAARGPEAWRWGFVVIGCASFISGLLMLLIQEPLRGASEPELSDVITAETARRYTLKWADLRALIRVRSWWWLMLKNVLDAIGLHLFHSWLFSWLDGIGLQQSAVIVVSLTLVGTMGGLVLFGWLSDRLDQRFPDYGRLTLVLAGMIVLLLAAILFFTANGDNLVWLFGIAFLFGLGSAATATNVRWPIAQAVLPPELRGSGQAFTLMATGIAAAPMLAVSGWVADQVGVTSMLLLIIPIPLLVSIVAWLPLFRTYPADRETLHRQLAQQRVDLLDDPGR